ncbi:MAG: HNH endonuclease [Ruminococcus flavefaciens]|nr:HNH endonuclease [Ruminococcus flavefaciens]
MISISELPNKRIKDITGLEVGLLKVIRFDHIDEKTKYAMWLCECKCGNKKVIQSSCLTKKNPTQSCGCLQKEFARKHMKNVGKLSKGNIKGNKYLKHEDYYEGYDLNNNMFLIDNADYDMVSKHTWRINTNGYFYTNIDNHKVYLHRFVLGCTFNDGIIVDHIDGNRYDCRKSNLRKADHYVNAWNTITRNKYGAKNIRKRGNKYEVRGVFNYNNYHLGSYDNIKDAIDIRVQFENANYKEYRRKEN